MNPLLSTSKHTARN